MGNIIFGRKRKGPLNERASTRVPTILYYIYLRSAVPIDEFFISRERRFQANRT